MAPRNLSCSRTQLTFCLMYRPRRPCTPTQSPIVSILLRHFNWNSDRLIEKFLDSAALVLQDAGEPTPDPASHSMGPPPAKRIRLDSPSAPAAFVCGVCCDDSPAAVFRLRCQHVFCEPCWQEYVSSKIKDEGQCLFRCMHDECRTVVDGPSIAKLVEPSVKERSVLGLRSFSIGRVLTSRPGIRSSSDSRT